MGHEPNKFQKVIYSDFRSTSNNMLVGAVAGSGKTTSLLELMKFARGEITFLAFNKSIVEELKERVPRNVNVMTMHSLGIKSIMRKHGKVNINANKTGKFIKQNLDDKAWGDELKKSEVGLIYLTVPRLVDIYRMTLCESQEDLLENATRIGAEFNLPHIEYAMDVIGQMSRYNKNPKEIDFTDMIYLPATDSTYSLNRSDIWFVDECFPYNQYIAIDGGKKKIGTLCNMFKSGQNMPKVPTFNEQTKLFELKSIKKVWCNGERDIYSVTLGGKRKVKSTENHRYLTTDGWKMLRELRIGDAILSNYKDQPYHKIHEGDSLDMIIGSVLGDGGLHTMSKSVHRLRVVHGEKQKEYLKWKALFMGCEVQYVEKNGYSQTPAYRFSTKSFYHKEMSKEWCVRNITSRALAIAFMDDGHVCISSKGNNTKTGATLHSLAPFRELVELLSKTIEGKWSINSVVCESKSSSTGNPYWYLRFNKYNALKLSKLIAPFMHRSMSYKLMDGHELLIQQRLWNKSDANYGCMVVTSEMKYDSTQPVYDMEIEDNHNFIITSSAKTGGRSKAENFGLIAHNCQDLSPCQHLLFKRARGRSRFVAVGDPHQCQPPGTKVMLHNGIEVNIEDIRNGDRVVGYDTHKKGGFTGYHPTKQIAKKYRKVAPEVLEITSHHYEGNIIVVSTECNTSKYTLNHRCMVRMKDTNKYILYLMESNGRFRIGISPVWSTSGFGLNGRSRQEGADSSWILGIFNSKEEAYAEEQYYSYEYGVPQLRFLDNATGTMRQDGLDAIWKRFDLPGMTFRAISILSKFGRDINYPFWERGSGKHNSRYGVVEVRACNIIPEIMQMAVFDKLNKIPNKTHKAIFKDLSLRSEKHSGPVYSLKVSGNEMYVADNILTHNSIYGFTGADSKSFSKFLNYPNTKQYPLSVCYRCPTKVVAHANAIYDIIESPEWMPVGEAYKGNFKDAEDGDMVICRNVKPLVSAFFKLIAQQKKAYIKGKDIGENLIKVVKPFKGQSIDSMFDGLLEIEAKLEEELMGQDITNPRKHPRYITLTEKHDIIKVISNNYETPREILNALEEMFGDNAKEGVILSSIHKSKGLEADNVFFLDQHLIPSQYANTPEQIEQEMNLKYVAITRAKKKIIYCFS